MQHILCAACLSASVTATAQVTVSGGNVSVKTPDGTAVDVQGNDVAVKAPHGGQTAIAVGSGRKAVNVGSANVVTNSAGTIESQASVRPADKHKKSRKADSKEKDSEFWGEKGFWGDEGPPGGSKKAK